MAMKLIPMEPISLRKGDSFPINPFHYDAFSMGTQLSAEIYLMHANHHDSALKGAYLVNINTGECNKLVLE